MSARYSRNSWDKYNTANYDSDVLTEVINSAGPNSIYHRPGYSARINGRTLSASYQINEDPNPLRVVKQTAPITQRQNVRIRYLQPPSTPKHAPIIVQERMLTPPPPPPPLVITQRQATPPKQPPLIIRERPPEEPQVARHPTFIEKIIPGPPPPPQQVIVNRIAAVQQPRDLVYEKWLPYGKVPDREVIVQKGRVYAKQPTPKNVIIDHEIPHVAVERHVYNEGTYRADPSNYSYLNGSAELKVVDKIYDMPEHTLQVVNHSRPSTPKYYLKKLELVRSKTDMNCAQTSMGPYNYSGPWNTTYRTSYTPKRTN